MKKVIKYIYPLAIVILIGFTVYWTNSAWSLWALLILGHLDFD